jgi:hypothetical protein
LPDEKIASLLFTSRRKHLTAALSSSFPLLHYLQKFNIHETYTGETRERHGRDTGEIWETDSINTAEEEKEAALTFF